MYRASLLMSALLARLGQTETDDAARTKRSDASLQLFMNAYLLFSETALADLKPLLPSGTGTSAYEKIHVPSYELSGEEQNQGNVTADVRIPARQEYHLMQMICGDILNKARKKYAGMQTLIVSIQQGGQPVATGRWDREKDEIVLKLQ